MSVEVSEMRPDDYPHVEALLQPTGGDGQAAQDGTSNSTSILNSASLLGLVARYENEIVAAIICDLEGKCGYVHQKDLSDQELQDRITRSLVEKVTRKLNARGITRCRINLPHNTKEHPLWETAKWNDFFEADNEQPVRSTGAVDQMVAQYYGAGAPDTPVDDDVDQKPEFEDVSIPAMPDEALLTTDSDDPSADSEASPAAAASGDETSVAAGADNEVSPVPAASDDEAVTPQQDVAA